jgi:hypothetical protein
MATEKEIEKLKQDWADDPCWDIEDTEGFEEHHKELKEFSDKMKAQWRIAAEKREQRELEELKTKAKKIGCEDNLKLASYLFALEDHIYRLEEMIREIQSK